MSAVIIRPNEDWSGADLTIDYEQSGYWVRSPNPEFSYPTDRFYDGYVSTWRNYLPGEVRKGMCSVLRHENPDPNVSLTQYLNTMMARKDLIDYVVFCGRPLRDVGKETPESFAGLGWVFYWRSSDARTAAQSVAMKAGFVSAVAERPSKLLDQWERLMEVDRFKKRIGVTEPEQIGMQRICTTI